MWPGKVFMKINKNLFIALCAALFLAVVIIAFLVGRQSAPQKQPSDINPRATSLPQTGSSENIPVKPPQYSGVSGNQAGGTGNFPQTANANKPQSSQTMAASAELAQTTDTSEKEAVKNYFRQMDSIGTIEMISGNSQELAGQMVQNALNQDYSGIDEIIQKCRRVKSMAEAVTAPAPCAEFHAQIIESINESSAMYSDFKNYFQRKDESMLKSLSERANRLNLKVTMLDSMQKSIKSKYGIY